MGPETHLTRRLRLLVIGLAALASACAAPQLQRPGAQRVAPSLADSETVMDDGYRLPLRSWGAAPDARAVLLAVHGFNDYSNAFDRLGSSLASQGLLVYAYDQRGFGESAQRGRWAGTERMIRDLEQIVALLRLRHPRLPLFLLGESMGGGLVLAASARDLSPAGTILVAPAVWSRDTMNPLLRLLLWAGAHTFPGLELTGEIADVRPSDNLAMLRDLSRDPLVIKATRIDALWGVTNLMDRAKRAVGDAGGPLLLLYGENDRIIPRRAFCALLGAPWAGSPDTRIVLYGDGWHMLTRDLQGDRVIADITAWLTEPGTALPSGEETGAGSARMRALCPSSTRVPVGQRRH